MRRLLLVSVVVLAVAVMTATTTASAHPLGNFTINRYSEIALSGNRVYVLYVLDMAEIPAVEALDEARRLGKKRYALALAEDIGRGLELTLAGERQKLRLVRTVLAFPPGQAGLKTLRLEALLETAPRKSSLTRLDYRDLNYRSRIGWREVVVKATNGSKLDSSSAPAVSLSDRLRTYPKESLQSPLDVSEARASFVPGRDTGIPPALGSPADLERQVAVGTSNDGFARLISEKDLSAGFILLSLWGALFWGAAHAFSPGHGKAIVAGYLIGTRGRPRDAFLLGLIVTATHTAGVFALGGITLLLSAFIVPEQLYPWLNLVSALLVVGVGLAILRWRVRIWRRGDPLRGGHGHGHSHGVAHGHGHDHDHHPSAGRGGLLGIGISAGIVPCPTALVVLLAAISLQRVGYGLVLIVAFSVGLAAAVTGIGLVAVTARRAFSRMSFEGPIVRALPTISAIAVLGLGVAMTLRALPTLL